MTKNRRLAYLALTYNAVIWGCAFPIVKPAFDFLTPMQYLYFRFLVAGIISLPYFIYHLFRFRPTLSYSLKVLLLELFGLPLPLLLLYTGLDKTTALEASLIGATGPIFVVLGGIIFLHERESKREWQGLALALFGSLLLVADPLLTGKNIDTLGSTYGNLLIVSYNVIYAIYAVMAKKFYRRTPAYYFGSLVYLLTAGIYAFFLSSTHSLPNYHLLTTNFQVFLPVLYMALPGGFIAFILYLYAQSKIEVSEANLFTYLNGAVAIPASFLLLGEVPSPLAIIAIILIAYGVLHAETLPAGRQVRKN